MRKNVDKREICDNISKELNVDPKIVRKIVDFQFQSLATHIREVKEVPFKLPYIGKVYLKSKPEPDILEDFEL